MPPNIRIACCQLPTDVEDPAAGAARASAASAGAIADGAQLVVLPELSNSGYVFRSREEVEAIAETRDGDLLRSWRQEAARGGAVIVGGFAERGDDGRIFNSSALVDGSGVLAVYRKLHLWNDEANWFAPGADPAPVIDTRHGRIGLAVCYDLEFPELTRGLALQGADLIALPANWPRDDPPAGMPAVLHSLAATTAYFNKVFVAVCDRCGSERGVEFEGGSVIAGPDGGLAAGPVAGRGSETLIADCDLGNARDKRTGPRNDAFADRRPDWYLSGLSNPGGR